MQYTRRDRWSTRRILTEDTGSLVLKITHNSFKVYFRESGHNWTRYLAIESSLTQDDDIEMVYYWKMVLGSVVV